MTNGSRSGWGDSVTPRPFFTPRKDPVPILQGLSGTQSWSGQVLKISPPPGFDSLTFEPVASRYTDWATRPTYIHTYRGQSRFWEKKEFFSVCPFIYVFLIFLILSSFNFSLTIKFLPLHFLNHVSYLEYPHPLSCLSKPSLQAFSALN
jgi:hypothetical protein